MSSTESPEPAAEIDALRARVASLEAALLDVRRLESSARPRLPNLHNSEQVFASIFGSAPIGIVVGNLDESLLFANPAFEQITGYSGEDVARLSVAAITHPEDFAQEQPLIEDLLDGRRDHYVLQKRYIHRDGHIVPVLLTGIALRDDEGVPRACVALVEDLSPRLRAEEARLAVERKLLEAQRLESLGVMAAGIAHDFNNILTAVLGNAELALLSPSLDPTVRYSLVSIVEGAQRGAELTRQILTYVGKGHFYALPVDVNQLIGELVDLLHGATGRRAQLTLELFEPLPRVEADSAQLRQMLLNLVINAGEAIEPSRRDGLITIMSGVERLGRDDLDGLVEGGELPAGSYVRLTVVDNGVGMDPATLNRIFDPFFTTKFLGRGLGLAAVRGIVRAHRGTLRVESAPGAGTRFSLWLPAERSS